MWEKLQKGYPLTVEDCCRHSGIKRGAVCADIKALKQFHPDLYFDHFKGSYVIPNPKKKALPLELSDREFFMLILGTQMFARFSGTSFESVVSDAIDKVKERLPESVRVDADDYASMVEFTPGGILTQEVNHKMYLDLHKAIKDRLYVDITYFTATSRSTNSRRIEPYRLLYWDSAWYVVGFCHLKMALRTFALHRIKTYKVCGEKFVPMSGDKIDAHMKAPFRLEHGGEQQRVKIHFRLPTALYIKERQWHKTEEREDHEDGSCTLSFVAQSLDEVKRWVLEKGADARVLEPAALEEKVRGELRKGCDRYSEPAIK